MVKVRYICSKCGKESCLDIILFAYVITTSDLICDGCKLIKDKKIKNNIKEV